MRYFVFMICALLMAATIKQGMAQEAEKVGAIRVKVAVIDMNKIRQNASVVKGIQAQVEKFRAKFQSEITKEEDALRTVNQALGRKRAILSPEAFADERRKFEQHLASVQRDVQQRKKSLDKVLNDAMFEVQKSLNKIVLDIAKEHSLTLVLRKEQTVLVATPLNITGTVLKRLNEAVPVIKVSEPGK
jgi:Skp family chaperone for outer membrane proteins